MPKKFGKAYRKKYYRKNIDKFRQYEKNRDMKKKMITQKRHHREVMKIYHAYQKGKLKLKDDLKWTEVV